MLRICQAGLSCVIALSVAGCYFDTNEPVNAAPVVAAANFAVEEDAVLRGQLAASDGDGDLLTFTLTAEPGHGSLALSSSGAFEYRPWADVSGADRFRFAVSDGRGATVDVEATITIVAVNDAPVARHDIVSVERAMVDRIAVLDNDRDVDGDPLVVSIVGAPSVGTAVVNVDNTVRLEGLPADFRGVVTFSYVVSDGVDVAEANAAVFVDTRPFAAIYPRAGPDGLARVSINDFVTPPRALTPPGESAARLLRFRAARDGSVVAYALTDPGAPTASAWFCIVGTAPGATPACPPNPVGLQPLFAGDESFAVSADGRWVAATFASPASVASDAAPVQQGLHLLDTRSPRAWQQVTNLARPAASVVRFSPDSHHLYVLAGEAFERTSPAAAPLASGTALLRLSLDAPLAPPVVLTGEPADHRVICGFKVARDDAVAVVSRRGHAFLMVRTASPGTEIHLLSAGAIDREPTRDCDVPSQTDRDVRIVATRPWGSNWQVADVSDTPNPRFISGGLADNEFYIGAGYLNPDGNHFVYSIGRSIAPSVSDWMISYRESSWASSDGRCVGLDPPWLGPSGERGVVARFDVSGRYCMTTRTPSGFMVNGTKIRAPFTAADRPTVTRAFGDGFDLDRGAFLSAVDTSASFADTAEKRVRMTLTNFAVPGTSSTLDSDQRFDDVVRGPYLFLVDAGLR